MKTADMLAILEADLKRLRSSTPDDTSDGFWIDWHELFAREAKETWLVQDVWPMERQVHLHAARKTGKSLLSLWIAGNLAIGRDPFSGQPVERVRVAYLDYEMSRDDLLERIETMGFPEEKLNGWLFYAVNPWLPAMDTQQGGLDLLERLTAKGIQAVVIDTFSRVVIGGESDNDTYRHFYKWTGSLLKRAGIALWRLDHEGHLEGRSRGASAKADDVDIVFQLRAVEDGLELVRKASRLSWIPESIAVRETEPFGYTRSNYAVPAGTMEKVRELDAANVPEDASRREATRMLKEAGFTPGKTTVIGAAQTYRQRRLPGA